MGASEREERSQVRSYLPENLLKDVRRVASLEIGQ